MRRGGVPLQAGRQSRPHQHRLTEGDAAESGGIEAREGMERIALDLGARHRGIQEIQIEKGIVAHQHRARAIRGADGGSNFAEDALQRILFR